MWLLEKFKWYTGTSLVAQCLRLCGPSGGGLGLIPGQGTKSHMLQLKKIPHATTKIQDLKCPPLRSGAAKWINKNEYLKKQALDIFHGR